MVAGLPRCHWAAALRIEFRPKQPLDHSHTTNVWARKSPGSRQYRADGPDSGLKSGSDPIVAGWNIGAGKICRSCRAPLPQLYTPGPKQCEQCAGKHLVSMEFFRTLRWHCRFYEAVRRRLPKRLTFRDSAKIYEMVLRGHARSDKAAREALDLAIEIGRGASGCG